MPNLDNRKKTYRGWTPPSRRRQGPPLVPQQELGSPNQDFFDHGHSRTREKLSDSPQLPSGPEFPRHYSAESGFHTRQLGPRQPVFRTERARVPEAYRG